MKLNQMINQLPFFDEVFVHPSMGDGGLSLGAALCKAHEVGDVKEPLKLDHVYFGQRFSKSQWDFHLSSGEFKVQPFSYSAVAELINSGSVIGLFIGGTEYGPRALGNRSIVVRPTERGTHQMLNTKLKRTEIMPFAPSVLEEYAEEVFNVKKSSYTAEFMTMCYDTSDYWLEKIPAVVQALDKSSRPQVVRKQTNQ